MKLLFLSFVFFLFSSPDDMVLRQDVSLDTYVEFAEPFQRSVCDLNLDVKQLEGVGTFVDQYWILTSAQVGQMIDHKLAKGKGHQITFQDRTYDVEKVVVHPNFERDDSYNLAMVKLANRARKVRPMELYEQKSELGREIIVTGFNSDAGGSKQLLAGTNTVEKNSYFWLEFGFNDDNSALSTDLEAITGTRDSGSPAFLNFDGWTYLAGISAGPDTKDKIKEQSKNYCRVSSHIHWIRMTMET